jgi:predicted Zn-dependent protease
MSIPPETSTEAIDRALAHQAAGRLQEAECLLQSVLQSELDHPVANCALGLLYVAQGNARAAIPLLNTAVNADPREHIYWLSFSEALIEAGAIDQARFVLEKAREYGVPEVSIALLIVK